MAAFWQMSEEKVRACGSEIGVGGRPPEWGLGMSESEPANGVAHQISMALRNLGDLGGRDTY